MLRHVIVIVPNCSSKSNVFIIENHKIMTLFSKFFSEKVQMSDLPLLSGNERFDYQDVLEFRPICLESDLPIIHRWLNLKYSDRFWKLSGVPLNDMIQMFGSNDDSSHFVILANNNVIAYFEVYIPYNDELGKFHSFLPGDMGFHFLLGPAREVIDILPKHILNLTSNLLVLIVHCIFKYTETEIVYVEPDVKNIYAVKLAKRVGFTSECIIPLSYKFANLLSFRKRYFYNSYRSLLNYTK